jgi:hypothetical protein
VRARSAVLVLTPAFLLAMVEPARADGVPVHVTVHGQGTIRVRIADGAIAPCDSGRRLFDGQMAAGQSLVLTSATGVVCVEHTYGAFRKTNWTPSMFVRQRCSRRLTRCEPFIRVALSTQ